MTAEELAVEIERQAACDGACDDCVALRASAPLWQRREPWWPCGTAMVTSTTSTR